MRKIEREMIEAIKAKKDYTNDKTQVRVEGNAVKVYLHDNLIATILENALWLYDGGWESKTTKSRLNCLLSHFKLPQIYQKNYLWYIGDDEWTGSKTFEIVKTEEEESIAKCLKILGF